MTGPRDSDRRRPGLGDREARGTAKRQWGAGWMAPLAGALSHTAKGCGFDPGSALITGCMSDNTLW